VQLGPERTEPREGEVGIGMAAQPASYWGHRQSELRKRPRRVKSQAKTKRAAERVEAAVKTKVAEGRSRGTAARTVADLVERWYEWRQGVKEISPTTLEGYRRQIDQRIIPALGRIPVRRLDVETLDGFYAELRRRGKAGGEPLSPSTVRAVHTVLSGSLRQAVAWGWIPHNPARLATPPSVQRGDVAPPPVEQVVGLLATALERNPRLGLFLRLAVVLGARRGERSSAASATSTVCRCSSGSPRFSRSRSRT
jgi:hypothetical protein